MRKWRLDRVVWVCAVALALGGLERGLLAQDETGLDAAPGVVREALASIVRVEWTLADGTRKARTGYVDRRGLVVCTLVMSSPLSSAVVVDSAGIKHSVVGVAAMTRMSGLYWGYRAHGCLKVEWNGATPGGLSVIDALPDVGSDGHLIRSVATEPGDGAGLDAKFHVSPLRVYDNETDYVRFVAPWIDVMDTVALAECLVMMSDGTITGFVCGSERQLPMFPLRPEMVADVSLNGARVLVEIPETDLPVDGMSWEEYKAYVERVSALKQEIDDLKSLLAEDAGEAMLRAREVALEYAEHPAAWVMLWKCSNEAGEEDAAVLALERAADFDPHDRSLVLRLFRAYHSQEWPREPGDSQLEKVFRWASVSLDANRYLFDRLWQGGAHERAKERLEWAIRLAPNNPHYRAELKRLYGEPAAKQREVERTTRSGLGTEGGGVANERAELVFDLRFETDDQMFPESWRGEPTNPTASSLPSRLRTTASATIHNAAAKYPAHILEQLDAVYVLSRISCYGLEYGGTQSSRRVYISSYGLSSATTSYGIEFRFHSELSGLLGWKHGKYIDSNRWKAANPEGFKYIGPQEAIRSGRGSLSWNENTVKGSFLCEYSKASLQDDFDLIAATLFMGRKDLWTLYDRLDGIRTKVDIVIEFYQKFDPMFTKDYFRSLAGV